MEEDVYENDLLNPIGQSRMVGNEKLMFDEGIYKAGISDFSMNNKKSIRYLHHDKNNTPIGALQIMTDGPRSKKATIQNIYVAEPFRRNKIASGLLQRARQDFDVRHSKDLTNAGRAFALAVKSNGGEVDGITAYHGSPHEFEKFDTSKIGTGEGAQAFGHGLYFAESEPVAEGYRERLGKTSETSGETMADQFAIPHNLYKFMDENDISDHLKDINRYAEHKIFDQGKMKYVFPDGSMVVHEDDHIRPIQKQPGHMYEVHIDAHPDQFLDWDKPLSEQSEHVRNALANHTPLYKYQSYKSEDTGKDIYYKNKIRSGGKDIASDELKSLGIKGIKYFDAASRGKGEGSRNYVVFDHNDVNIKRRYEQGGAVDKYPLAENAEDHFKEMPPQEFLDRSRPLKDTAEDRKIIKDFKKDIKKGEKLDPLALYKSGKENGRHRATAAKELGIRKVPVHDYRKRDGGAIVKHALMVISKKA